MALDEFEFGFYDEAERKAQEAFELYEQGKILQALDELDSALEINPASSNLHFNKALALDSAGRFDDAIEEYKSALELHPNDPEILNSIAVDMTRAGEYDLAISTFEHIEKLESSNQNLNLVTVTE